MENQIAYQFTRNTNEFVCFSFREFKQRKYIDLRIFFKSDGSKELQPTKKGLTLSLQFFPELKKGIEHLEKKLVLENQ
jgi:hypothetical protein